MQSLEEAVLSVAFQSPESWRRIRTQMPPDAFTGERQKIFLLMRSRDTLNAALIANDLEAAEVMTSAEARRLLMSYEYNESASSAHLDDYLTELEQEMRRRQLTDTLKQLVRESEKRSMDTATLFDKAEQSILGITRSLQAVSEETTQSQRLGDALDHIADRIQNPSSIPGIDTGLEPLNELTGGWEHGTFNAILGVPSVGKTALWLQSANHVAKTHAPVAMVELEMSPKRLAQRQLTRESKIDYGKINQGNLTDEEFIKLSNAASNIVNFDKETYVAAPHVRSIQHIVRWFRRMHADHGCDTLWIDNLKRVSNEDAAIDRNEMARFTATSSTLGDLAVELNISVIALHHVRKLAPGQKKITAQDAYGSSALFQDCDVMILMNPTDQPQVIEFEGAKARDVGEKGRTRLVEFLGQFQLFQKYDPRYQQVAGGAKW